MFSIVDLPQPLGPTMVRNSPRRNIQRYPFESVDDAVAREKSLADVLQAEHWRAAQPIPVHPTAAMASISTISSGCARRRTSTVVLVGIAWL